MFTTDTLFDKVEDAIGSAILVAFDGCHKIYLAMDETEANWFRENYNGVHCDDRTFEGTPDEMLTTVKEWYAESCPLRFVYAVQHNAENPNDGFTSLIGQGEDQDDEDYENEFDDEDEDF